MTQQEKNMLIESYARGREKSLIESYIVSGPSEIKKQLSLNDEQWKVLFDYLVFNHNLLYKAVHHSLSFFTDSYIKHGMTHVRDVLDVADEEYDLIWTVVFDFLAIAHEGLRYHVLHHRDRYMSTLQVRGADFVRKVLGIWNERYDEHWREVLELLLEGVCDQMFGEQTFEHSLKAFSLLMNGKRIHKPVAKSDILKGLV